MEGPVKDTSFLRFVFAMVSKRIEKTGEGDVRKELNAHKSWRMCTTYERPPSSYPSRERNAMFVAAVSTDLSKQIRFGGSGVVESRHVTTGVHHLGKIQKKYLKRILHLLYVTAFECAMGDNRVAHAGRRACKGLEETSPALSTLRSVVSSLSLQGQFPQMVLNMHGKGECVLCVVEHKAAFGKVLRAMETYHKQAEILHARMAREPGRGAQIQFDKRLLQKISRNECAVGGLPVVEGVLTCPQVLTNLEIGYGSMVLTDQVASSYRMCISTSDDAVDEEMFQGLCDETRSIVDTDRELRRALEVAFSVEESTHSLAIRGLADLACMAVTRCFVLETARYPLHVFEDKDFMIAATRLVSAETEVVTGSLSGSFVTMRERQRAGNLSELAMVKTSLTRSEARAVCRLHKDGFAQWSNRSHALGDRRMLIMLTTTSTGYDLLRETDTPCVSLRLNDKWPVNQNVDTEALCKVWTCACAYVCKRMRGSNKADVLTNTWADIFSTLWDSASVDRFSESPQESAVAHTPAKVSKVVEMLYNIFKYKPFTLQDLQDEYTRVQLLYKRNLCGNDNSNRANMFFYNLSQKKGACLRDTLRNTVGGYANITPIKKLGVPARSSFRVCMRQAEEDCNFKIVKILEHDVCKER
ncbi:hypothetical protein CYMTET_44342 [Cymbomonas tetramitiformis]|uniref:Uncharacterized protein n=1 Tax=Cymbomonas tetramitiformis TaxID=36881 RepID=A0AAE0C0C5_9CHLO|nr:hypothetical protein CYMTET_44342 [Cymbomonas tetramitiformis]